jgi:hypothetical protein
MAKKKKIDWEIEREYWDDISYVCPVRGKVTQRVLVVRYVNPEVPEEPIHI